MRTAFSRDVGVQNGPSGSGVLLSAVVASGVLVFSEWLFFATKPSFLLTVPVAERLWALATASALLGLLLVVALAPIVALFRTPRVAKAALLLARVPIAALVAITALLMVDTFTVTLFHCGVRDADTALGRGLYGALLFFFLALGFRWTAWLERLSTPRRRRRILAAALSAEAVVLASAALAGAGQLRLSSPGVARDPARRYDIVLMGADGVEASRTSLYGYARNTTPFLRQMAESSLVVESAYPNSGQTTGSITSLLTGKLPTTTRVHYPPDALRATDAYEHLPGLLRRMGYRTFFAGVRNYADPLELRLIDGFDEVGSVRVAHPRLTHRVSVVTGDTAAHLLNLSVARIGERLAHVVLGIPMAHPKRQVSSGLAARESDDGRFRELVRFLEGPGEPKFAHAHFLGTHGPDFSPTRRTFSKPVANAPAWDRDAQDDAVLDFDDRVRELFGVLDRLGRRDRTIVVIYSDHGQLYRLDAPLPLVFMFPPGGPRGRVRGTTQLLDVAPTLLEALGVPRPSWMQGASLLGGNVTPCRSILTATSAGEVEEAPTGGFRVIYELPWYSLGRVALISCAGTWWLDPRTGSTPPEFSAFGGAACDPACTPVRSEATEFITRALSRGGYPVDSRVAPLSWSEAIALASAVKTGTSAGLPGRAAGNEDSAITRAEAAALAGRTRHPSPPVVRMPGKVSFSDVGPSHPLQPWIVLLDQEVGGVECEPGRFCPDGTIRPAEMRRWLRLAPLPDPNGPSR
jgi:arylsulfatase A-like enzyme